MKPRKNTLLTILLGLMLFVSASGMAQTTAQGDQKKKSEACCSMESCCKGDSCEMKEDGTAKAEGCCSGDSCDMKAKHDAKGHGDKAACCKMKHKDSKNKAKQKSA